MFSFIFHTKKNSSPTNIWMTKKKFLTEKYSATQSILNEERTTATATSTTRTTTAATATKAAEGFFFQIKLQNFPRALTRFETFFLDMEKRKIFKFMKLAESFKIHIPEQKEFSVPAAVGVDVRWMLLNVVVHCWRWCY